MEKTTPVTPEKAENETLRQYAFMRMARQLIEEKEHLLSLLKPIKDSIEDIKSKYPYNLKAIVESEKKTEQMRHELEHVLEQYNELIEIYKQTIDEMLR